MSKLNMSSKHPPDGHAIDVAPTELGSIFLARSYKDVAPTELLGSHRLVSFWDWEHDIRSLC